MDVLMEADTDATRTISEKEFQSFCRNPAAYKALHGQAAGKRRRASVLLRLLPEQHGAPDVERESGRREEGGRRTAARRGEQLRVEEPRSGPGFFATETLEARYEDGISGHEDRQA